MKKFLILILAAAATASCQHEEIDLVGTWVQPIPGRTGGWSQGMQFNADGTANSVNMYTLVYDTWKREGDMLILTGKSVGNRIAFPFTDTLYIDKRSNNDSLVLRQGDRESVFKKIK
ncbi:MAG TPA: lipocalin family protein [Candidatus Tidjanibacter gallistercoris]|nr:lipocalin family protein [Candidatus Tidjanibacter gallistercoris]